MKINLNTDFYRVIFMSILTMNVLKEIIDRIPDDFSIEFDNGTTVAPLSDVIEVDITGKKIIFRE